MLGEAAAVVSAMFFSLVSVFIRWGGQRVDLFWLNALRYLTAALVMLAALLVVRGPDGLLNLPAAAALWLALTALSMVAVGDSLFYLSCQYIGVARSSPIANSYPLVSVVLAVLFLAEPASWRLGAGTVLILLGAYLVARPGEGVALAGPTAESRDRRTGVILALGACLGWGLGAIFDRMAMQVPAVDLAGATSFRLLFATLLLFLLAATRPRRAGSHSPGVRRPAITGGFIVVFFAVAIVCGVGASLTWLYSVQQIGAARASLLSATGPLWGIVLAALLLREPVARSTYVGALFTVAGVWVIL